MYRYFLAVIGICFSHVFLFSQNTVGLLSSVPSQSLDGYNLIYPHNQPHVFLMDACGEVVHRWEGEDSSRPGNTAYLREDGNLVMTSRPAQVTDDAIWAGGGGATVEIRDWDNQILWSYTLNNDTARLHHDIEPMPNGNILMLAWETLDQEETIELGRDPSLLEDQFWPDYIFEINPDNDSIVWEWHVKDDLIQDFDESQANFGVVSEHPELIDINYDNDSDPDWLHSNAIDYHPVLDQIMICVPYFDEIWIIDHTTTTEQAAGHIGGFGGRGGDLLYRWGNPSAYKGGGADDQTLFFPHDAHWVDDHLESMHPLVGQIAVFNNRFAIDHSAVNTFMAPWDMYAWAYNLNGNTWGPDDYELTITHPEPTKMYSTGLSSVQFLANNNILICSGRDGYSFELSPENDIVWEYKTPLIMGQPATQGDTLTTNDNLTFRMDRYPLDYPAFEDKDLTGGEWIELVPNMEFCDSLTTSTIDITTAEWKIYPNPTQDFITLEWKDQLHSDIHIITTTGQVIQRIPMPGSSSRSIHLSLDLSPGLYFVSMDNTIKKLIIN